MPEFAYDAFEGPGRLAGFAAYDPFVYLQIVAMSAGFEIAQITPDWHQVMENSGIAQKARVSKALVEDAIRSMPDKLQSQDANAREWKLNKPIQFKDWSLKRCLRRDCKAPLHFTTVDEAMSYLWERFENFDFFQDQALFQPLYEGYVRNRLQREALAA